MPIKKQKAAKSDDSVTQGEDPQVSGVFQTDFPIYCKSNGLPVISVKLLESAAETATPSSDCSFLVMIKVEMSDDPSIKKLEQLTIRGWKVTQPVITSLQLSLKSHLITTVSLWETGLNSDLLKTFLNLLPQVQCKFLELGGSPIDDVNCVSEFIDDCNSLLGLRLRCCEISDDFVMILSTALKKNPSLQQLDLSYNKIGDDGAKALSKALRVNNNLLVLSLANNVIGDVGAVSLVETLREFQLNHEEIVQRRKVLSQCLQLQWENLKKSSTTSRRSSSLDQRSSSHDKLAKSSAGAMLKASSFIAKMKKGAESKKVTTPKGKNKSVRDDGAATPRDSPSRTTQSQSTCTTVPLPTGPLIDGVREEENGNIIISSGNLSLISLSLSGNRISSAALKSIVNTLEYQTQVKQREEKEFVGKPQPGLMTLFLLSNTFPCENETYTKICKIIKSKDPILTMKTASLPEETDTQN